MIASPSAHATPITDIFTFSFTRYIDTGGTYLPVASPTLTGSITVQYDPTLTYTDDTADLDITSLSNVIVSDPIGFSYADGLLELGNTPIDPLVASYTNDLVITFDVTNPDDPTFVSCTMTGYTCGVFSGTSTVVSADPTIDSSFNGWFYTPPGDFVPTLTPEPPCLLLMATGFGVLAELARRRSRKVKLNRSGSKLTSTATQAVHGSSHRPGAPSITVSSSQVRA
jgi:hypothetical protein